MATTFSLTHVQNIRTRQKNLNAICHNAIKCHKRHLDNYLENFSYKHIKKVNKIHYLSENHLLGFLL